MCFGHSKEPSQPDSSFEYPQHTFLLRNKKNNFQLRTIIWGPVNTVEVRHIGHAGGVIGVYTLAHGDSLKVWFIDEIFQPVMSFNCAVV